MHFTTLTPLLLAALAASQTLVLYSDTACTTVLQSIGCGDVYNSCTAPSSGALSYSITADDGQVCDSGIELFNAFTLTDTCGGSVVIGGGCDDGCTSLNLVPEFEGVICSQGTTYY